MLSTINKVEKMLDDKNWPAFKFIPSKDYYPFYGHMGYYDYPTEDDFRFNDAPLPKGTINYKCHSCGRSYSEDSVLPVKLIYGGRGFMCENCLMSKAEWCRECGEAFEIDPKHPGYVLCPDCSGGRHGRKSK